MKLSSLEDLQDSVDSVTRSDTLLMLGDFNAHVGTCDCDDGLWYGVLIQHGIGMCNLVG